MRELGLIGMLHEGPADWMRVTRCRSSRIIGAPDKRNIATGVQSSTSISSITAGLCLGKPPGLRSMSGYHSPGRGCLPSPDGLTPIKAQKLVPAGARSGGQLQTVTVISDSPARIPTWVIPRNGDREKT